MSLSIVEPGVYFDIPEDEYHRDPVPGGSLSSSGAKRLLPPYCPARFVHERQHGQPPRAEFDVGRAAHALVLGVGADLGIVDAPDWKTKAAQAERDEHRRAGRTPLLRKQYDQVVDMGAAIQANPLAAALLDPTRPGRQVEVSLFAEDPATGTMRRGRLDVLPPLPARRDDGSRPRLLVPDFKTAASADPWTFARAAAGYGYHQQAAWYVDLVRDLVLDEHDPDPAFLFVVQEKDPPYLVSVVELDQLAVDAGRRRNRAAIDLYAECVRTGEWPSHTRGEVALVPLPRWATSDHDAEEFLP